MEPIPYRHDGVSRPPIAILGVPFDPVTIPETVGIIEKMIHSGLPHYLATANVDFLVQALHDVELRRILIDAHTVLCDGTPVLWASRLLGNRLPERVAGADLVPQLIARAAEKQYRVFFLGGSPGSSNQAVSRLRQQYPKLLICGHYSPPYNALLEMDHDQIRQRIAEAKPDLLFVCFGCPKQEKWIAMHYRQLGVPVSIGVGGTIDFLAGTTVRAPRWMQVCGLEWVFRLAQEPRRLLPRYTTDLSRFSQAFLRQWWHMATPKKAPQPSSMRPVFCQVSASCMLLELPEQLDVHSVKRDFPLYQQAFTPATDWMVDMSGTLHIDSTGAALIMRWEQQARSWGRRFIVVAPSPAARQVLDIMGLTELVSIEANRQTAQTKLQTPPAPFGFEGKQGDLEGRPILYWTGEITAANAAQVWTQTEPELARHADCGAAMLIDLHQLHFVDSTGVGLMVRTVKAARRLNLRLSFIGVQANVQNVLRLTKLETFILGESK